MFWKGKAGASKTLDLRSDARQHVWGLIDESDENKMAEYLSGTLCVILHGLCMNHGSRGSRVCREAAGVCFPLSTKCKDRKAKIDHGKRGEQALHKYVQKEEKKKK